MPQHCEQCQKVIVGAGVRTATRLLCDECGARFTGLAAGYLAGHDVPTAISVSGWYERLRKKKR
ncbi:hypothetical protein [Microbacterium sp. KR10-403]|uniref:hypothetical protein n=1 Tax=Microbacterium sp. KR10-403 TaxID=3158581 RepID=UPI0032E50D08